MMKVFIFIIGILSSLATFAQTVRLHEEVVNVPIINSKIVFVKEVPRPSDNSSEAIYRMLKDWAKESYGKDPFISSVRYDAARKEIIAKSRIELLLPANSEGVREKFIMRYRVNGYIFDDRCVLEVTEISYLYQVPKGQRSTILPRVIRGEDFITDSALTKNDELQEMRGNMRKSTIFFLNQLTKNFESAFGYMSTFNVKVVD